ncbi:DUF732 domain-containing protein [Mycobacterium shimoidei]|uniref:DUF732 domain-containing protein n=1 Tax=Mycobacterium shimoidei TaxID=29313 RepID=A0A1E3TIF2_MYCSH|nr:DUF732 domain-containing protein [Mycobacterium shimoidei]MCV7257819.1 DUF732 domain-containing protein [Mycobacterium shimoidei]ODR14222.1 hypothetical protein BHQ16_07305 [Mycobacterium shimoidei]ORW83882.1 hypothetical protein AWC26_00165 [Mycobacterium shimoidei]SRX91923.1 hypothetical protein MSP7336_00144 [Mycobacterium shimoidei]
MRKQLLAGVAVAAGLIGSVIGAPSAHADEQAFLNELRSNGFPGLTFAGQQMPDGAVVAQGYMACNRLHLGESPDQLIAQVNPNDAGIGRMIVQAAQHHLCPDTL